MENKIEMLLLELLKEEKIGVGELKEILEKILNEKEKSIRIEYNTKKGAYINISLPKEVLRDVLINNKKESKEESEANSTLKKILKIIN